MTFIHVYTEQLMATSTKAVPTTCIFLLLEDQYNN